MKLLNKKFSSQEFDALLLEWMSGSLTPAMMKEWEQVLSSDHGFREEFCEFIKVFRNEFFISDTNKENS